MAWRCTRSVWRSAREKGTTVDAEVEIADKSIAERVIAMKRGQFSLKEMLAQPMGETKAEQETKPEPPKPAEAGAAAVEPAETLPALDDLPPLPGQGEAYKAHARASNKPLATLVLLMGDASARGFSYSNLDTLDLVPGNDPGQGPMICMRFNGIVATEVRVSGRNIDGLYSYLGHHRVAWVKERPPSRDFIPQGETVVTGIRISKIEG